MDSPHLNYLISLLVVLVSLALLWVAMFCGRRWHGTSPPDQQTLHRGLLGAAITTGILLILMGTVVIFIHVPPHESRDTIIGFSFVSLFSGLVGFTEIAQRYQDRPLRLLTVPPALVYIYINLAAGIGAYALVEEFDVFKQDSPHAMVYRVMLASFGAIAFFRSSLFTARVGDVDVEVGPATLLKGLLSMTDTLVNRWQATARADVAASLMREISFQKAKGSLTSLCMTTVQYITPEQQADCAAAIQKIDVSLTDEVQKSLLLGTYLMQIVGPDVVSRAVMALGDTIKRVP
ncbi:MAG TPA: hypothetical protein VL752_14665 [Acidisoma sp.]|uniref:hypothetical protein n=1 Tax=Acidisoma sp. TaxID=1872115 RepID=UPI002D0CE61D|nr:hypothetical protein [Acidisoma sp.]HTI02189.1 hypothetical protein [Acidisoma sp.]